MATFLPLPSPKDAQNLRLDPRERKKLRLKTLEELRDPSTGLCYGVLQPRFVERGVPAVEIGDLETGVLRPTHLRISAEQHHEYRRSAVVARDVLISVKGTLGVTAIAPDGTEESNVNRDIARLRTIQAAIDPYYLVVFLRSPLGSRSLQRIIRGTIQRNLNIGDLLTHRVFVPDALVQRYMETNFGRPSGFASALGVSKLPRSPQLRFLVPSSAGSADAIQTLLFVLAGGNVKGDPVAQIGSSQVRLLRSRVAPTAMFGRLNAEAYQQEFLNNDRVLRASGWTLSRLGDLVSAPINNSIRGVTEHLTNNGNGVPMFRPADIDGLWMDQESAPRIGAAFESEHAKARVAPGDIVLAIAGTVAAVGRIGENVSQGNINGSSARIRLPAPLRGFALFFLASPFGQRELMRWAVGSVQKHLNLEDLTEVRTPNSWSGALRAVRSLPGTEWTRTRRCEGFAGRCNEAG